MCNKCNSNKRKNFFINVDKDGKCPSLTQFPARPYYTQYVNDKPVVVVPYIGQTQVWDYSQSKFIALNEFQGRVITF